MSRKLDSTHDPSLRCFVPGADDPQGDLPVQNLPFCRFRHGSSERARIGVGIGDCVLDLARTRHHHLLNDLRSAVQLACVADTLYPLMALDPDAWVANLGVTGDGPVLYYCSGFDAGTAAAIYPEARVIIGVDKTPFARCIPSPTEKFPVGWRSGLKSQ